MTTENNEEVTMKDIMDNMRNLWYILTVETLYVEL